MGTKRTSKLPVYPLPLVTEDTLVAVQAACRRLLPETDICFVCIRDQNLRGDQVTAVINAVLPDLRDNEPVPAGHLDRAIDIYLAFTSSQQAA